MKAHKITITMQLSPVEMKWLKKEYKELLKVRSDLSSWNLNRFIRFLCEACIEDKGLHY